MTDDNPVSIPSEYGPFLDELKERIRSAQLRAAVSVNHELVVLYWNLGRRILAAQEARGWGSQVIDKLSADLVKAFPGMKGFSPRNLKYMRAFARAWPEEAIVQSPLAQLTWYHNIALLEKLDSQAPRLWYAQRAIENGWSRNVMALHIGTCLHLRQGKSLSNFERTFPFPQSAGSTELPHLHVAWVLHALSGLL